MYRIMLGLLLFVPGSVPGRPPALPQVAANSNRAAAGRLANGVLTVHLVAAPGRWYPEADSGGMLPIAAFGEEGRPLENPGPMLRVPAGTEIRATVRNAVPGRTLVLHGFHSRPGTAADTVAIPAGATRALTFQAGAPGTYFYWGTTTGAATTVTRRGEDSQLNGAFIVEAPGAPRTDEVMVISVWIDTVEIGGHRFRHETAVINGAGFGHRPWLDYTVGDSVRWRVINASDRAHPMHLHGFFFRVDAHGDAEQDTTYTEREQRLAVTQALKPGRTMRVAWRPDRPGDWIFHCHIAYHIVWDGHLPRTPADTIPPAHQMAMLGMVVGLHIHPAGPPPPLAARTDTQRVRLLVQERAGVFNGGPGYGYIVQHGAEPARDSIADPGMPLVLTRGRPAVITVVNHLDEATAVHWHGIELESYYDGVSGLSGSADHRAPMIEPGDSFVVRLTPRRAGTFIYHTHLDDLRQLLGGLVAPLIVVEPGDTFDPATDHVVFFDFGGRDAELTDMWLNGSAAPPPMQVRAGVPQRLRFISMTTYGNPEYRLVRADSAPVSWIPIGKDGADLPPWQETSRPATVAVRVGETYDFRWTPERPGTFHLQMWAGPTLARSMNVVVQ